MILGIGIDTVEIERFAHWHTMSPEQQLRVFTTQEIQYCLESVPLSAERFAARFAAREAAFKAVSSATNHDFNFLTFCTWMQVINTPNGAPSLIIDWDTINTHLKTPLTNVIAFISITHTKKDATAFVVLEQA